MPRFHGHLDKATSSGGSPDYELLIGKSATEANWTVGRVSISHGDKLIIHEAELGRIAER